MIKMSNWYHTNNISAYIIRTSMIQIGLFQENIKDDFYDRVTFSIGKKGTYILGYVVEKGAIAWGTFVHCQVHLSEVRNKLMKYMLTTINETLIHLNLSRVFYTIQLEYSELPHLDAPLSIYIYQNGKMTNHDRNIWCW